VHDACTFRAIPAHARASSRASTSRVSVSRDGVRVTCNTKLTGLVTRSQPARSDHRCRRHVRCDSIDVICESSSSIALALFAIAVVPMNRAHPRLLEYFQLLTRQRSRAERGKGYSFSSFPSCAFASICSSSLSLLAAFRDTNLYAFRTSGPSAENRRRVRLRRAADCASRGSLSLSVVYD